MLANPISSDTSDDTDLREILTMCTNSRRLIELGFPPSGAAGTCLYASVFLQVVLDKFAGCRSRVRGGDGLADSGARDVTGKWRGHYWVEGVARSGESFVADITADQFGYKPVVVLTKDLACERYRAGDDEVVSLAADDLRRSLGMVSDVARARA